MDENTPWIKMKPLVEIIILNYNNKELSEQCLKSVLKTDYSNLKITFVDNGSSDKSYDSLRKIFGKKVKFIRNEKNLGFAEGNNVAMRKSNAKYICLLNNDTTVKKDWIKKLVNFMETNENVGICQPKVLSLKDKRYFEYAGASGGFLDVFGYTLCRGRVFDDKEKDIGQYDYKREIFWACGVAMFIRRDILKKIGYLDKDFFAYAEELDLNWRAHLIGKEVWAVPSSVIYHLGKGTSGKNKKTSFFSEYLLHRNHTVMLMKNYSLKSLSYILPAKTFLEMITFFAFLIKKPSKSYAILKSILWIFLNFPLIVRKHREVRKIRKISDKEIMKKMMRTSIALQYFLNRKKKFGEYEGYLKK